MILDEGIILIGILFRINENDLLKFRINLLKIIWFKD